MYVVWSRLLPACSPFHQSCSHMAVLTMLLMCTWIVDLLRIGNGWLFFLFVTDFTWYSFFFFLISHACSPFSVPSLLYCFQSSLRTRLGLFGLPRCHSAKESAWQCRRRQFDPRVGKIPWSRNWQPIPLFLPGKSHVYTPVQSTGLQRSWTQFSNYTSVIPPYPQLTHIDGSSEVKVRNSFLTSPFNLYNSMDRGTS